MFKEVTLRNFLSYGPDTDPVTLGPLNVLLGANGTGKSNLIEAIALLASTPREDALQEYIRASGGVEEWIHKGVAERRSGLEIEVVVARPDKEGAPDLRHRIVVGEAGRRIAVLDERIENAAPAAGKKKPFFYFGFEDGAARLDQIGTKRGLTREQVRPDASILSQFRDPLTYPVLTGLADAYGRIRLFREWTIGRHASCRRPQPPDAPADFLRGDGANLALVLEEIKRHRAVRRRLEGHLQDLSPGFEGYDVHLTGGSVQLFLSEAGDRLTPASRLSDGTLRFLALLSILLHPSPPPVVVLEEPEIGMHPDLLPMIAKLLMEASARMQLIVTTHSDILVDALTPMPESVLFCDKVEGQTVVRRPTPAEIAASCGPEAVERMRLGQAWLSGDFGGRRW